MILSPTARFEFDFSEPLPIQIEVSDVSRRPAVAHYWTG